jgi:hypothetical protein
MLPVAFCAERDQVRMFIISAMASGMNMMYLKAGATAAGLAAPSISVKHLAT